MCMEPIHTFLSCLSQYSLSPHPESPSLVSPSEHATREQCLPGEHPPVPFQFQRSCSGTQNCQCVLVLRKHDMFDVATVAEGGVR